MNNAKNKSEENQKNNNLIKLYPFNGRSRYLIDKFYIIGYNYLSLHKQLIVNTPKSIIADKEKEAKDPYIFNLDEEPYILNEITSDYQKKGVPNEAILRIIYPKKLNFYYTSEEIDQSNFKSSNMINKHANNFTKIDFKSEKNKQNFPKSYKVVFSSNPHSENNSKKSINGFAYIFYKKFVEKKIFDKKKYTYYIPYTFCIISEFPYFNSFYKLCKCIKNLFSQKAIYIPIEFLIHNIISLSPSPLNSDVILDLKSSCDQYKSFGNFNYAISNIFLMEESNQFNNESNSRKTCYSNKEMKIFNYSEISQGNRLSFPIGNNFNNKKKLYKKKIHPLENNEFNNNLNNKQNESNYQIIKFKCLSGYPLIEYNLAKVLLNNLTPEQVIVIFLFTFLEKDVIFFGNDIEHLTLMINAFLNLNFPLNDEKYYFIGAAISFEDFSSGDSEFGLKNFTSIIGINDSYRPYYKNRNLKLKDHLVIDLDKGEIYFGMDEDNNDVNEKNKKLVKLIKRIYEGYEEEKNKRNTLYQAIKKLCERLKKIYEGMLDTSKKVINIGKFIDYDNNEAYETNYINSRTNTSININSTSINKNNIEIQEAFYEFVHNMCLYFYQNLSIKAQEDEQNKNSIKSSEIKGNKSKEQIMNVIFDKDYQNHSEYKYTEEELIFLDELTDTMKFQSFVYEFLQSYTPIDLYKIPLTFTEEFLSIISRKKEQISQIKNNISFFHLIDSLYNTGRKKEIKKVNFDLINFNYFKKYKEYFDREIYDKSRIKYLPANRNLVKYINDEKGKLVLEERQKILLYQTYELDDELLLKYLHFIKNLDSKEYSSSFYGSFYIEENKLKNIRINDIETKIENYCITYKLLTNSDICCANIILLFTLGLKYLRETMDCQTFLGILFQDFTVFRKYYSILLRMIYRLYQDPTNKKKLTSTLCYFPCINSIRIKRLVPNEDLLVMINQFNKININEFNFQEEEKVETKKDEKVKDVKLYGEELEETKISPNNLYVYHNFTKDRFISEREIIIAINNFKQIGLIEVYLKNGESIMPKIRFNNGIHSIDCFFISQKILLESLIAEYNKYIEDLKDNILGPKIILDACLNIFIFMRNSEEFKGKEDLFDVLQSIFYIFMNQLFILKSINENE